MTGAEVPVEEGGADEPVEEAPVLLDGEPVPTEPPHPDSRAEALKHNSKADRNPRFLTANIPKLNDGTQSGANVVKSVHIGVRDLHK